MKAGFIINPSGLDQGECPGRQTTKFKDICIKFLNTTPLHGLKFIADNEITKGEKFYFATTFFLAVITSAYYIFAIYHRWRESPMIIATSSIPSSISSVPFPAITICNLNQAKKNLVKGFQKHSLNYYRLKSLCKSNLTDVPSHVLEMSGKGTEYRDFILNVSQSCEEMIISCKFGSKILNCRSIFQRVLTDEGLCCTFNAVNRRFMFFKGRDEVNENGFIGEGEAIDWTPEGGYGDGNLRSNVYPRPALGTGVNMGLTVVLNASLNDYYCSSASSAGFKMMMHSPTETPKVINFGYLLSPGAESRIIINPEVHKATEAIKSMNVKYRNCLFASESRLKFYRTYTKSNCELECELLGAIERCQCIPYYLPRSSSNLTVCGLREFTCIQQTQVASNSLLGTEVKCSRCRLGCFSLGYYPIITVNPLTQNSTFMRDEIRTQNDESLKDLAVVHFYYEHNSFRSKVKKDLLNFTDFLANSGGILGLFMGFSFLAAIEFLYFVSLVLYCTIKKLLLFRIEIKPRKSTVPAADNMGTRSDQLPVHYAIVHRNTDYFLCRKNYNPRFHYIE